MPDITPAEIAALAAFRHEIRSFLEFSERHSRAAGIEPRQHQLLLAVAGLPADERPTVGTVARRLAVRHHTAVELVGRAERGGLVIRARSREDRREVLIALTDRGRDALARLSVAHRDELRTVGPRLARALSELAGATP